VADDRSTTPYPWIRAGLAFAIGIAIYGAFPLLAPLAFSDGGSLPSLGIGLGLTVGVASILDKRLVIPLAAGAGLTVAIGALIAALPPVLSILLGTGIGIEVWALTWLFARTRASRLQSPVDVFSLVFVSVAFAIPVAVLAAVTVRWFDHDTGMFIENVRLWSTDDIFGLVVIAPAVILCLRRHRWSVTNTVEFAAVGLLSVFVSVVIFFIVTAENPGLLGWPYVALLGPAWLAVRLGAAAVAPVTAVVFWLAAVATARGIGPFALASDIAVDRLVAVEVFAIVLTSGLLALGILRDDRLRQLARAKDSSRLLREVIDGSDAVVYAKDYTEDSHDGRYVLVNQAWERMTGLSAEQTIGRTDRDLFSQPQAEGFIAHDHLVLAFDEPVAIEERHVRANGLLGAVSSAKFPLRGDDDRAWGVGGIATDVTESMQAHERELRQAELLRAVFELSPTPAMRMAAPEERSLRVLDANAAMLALLGLPAGAVDRCDLMSFVHPDDLATAWDIIGYSLTSTGTHGMPSNRQREIRLNSVDGRVVWALMSAAAVRGVRAGDVTEIVAQFEDFTARRQAELALSDQAMRDSVTGLPNRRALNDRLGSALLRLRRNPGTVTVLFCDLDRFKDVNDTYGHQVGDQLLVEVAERLRSALRPDDTVARLGGDEFVVLTEGVQDASDAVLTGLRLQDRLGAPWVHSGQTFRLEMSIGVAITEDPELTVDEVLRRADLAMYEAKDAGRNRIEVYQRSVDDEIQRAVAIQHDLRKAIDASGLVVHYQPIVRLADDAVVGAEALVRMRGSDGTLLLPASFVPQAEATGLVVPMGAWVLRRALMDLRKWRERSFEYTVAVNVSQWQHREDGFAAFVLDQAEITGVNPAWLVVEVTETALIHDPARSGRELAVLSRAGVGVALDDFGTGYSSLSWLTQLPVTTVKIDASFTAELGIDERKGAIVRALIEVSHDLGLSVVAEGVETREQKERLLELGCDQGQGYLFGFPTTVDDAGWL
jgi:diguanylate cyclase (GGDEF)-like protein/PAS domain S-box-containing protein